MRRFGRFGTNHCLQAGDPGSYPDIDAPAAVQATGYFEVRNMVSEMKRSVLAICLLAAAAGQARAGEYDAQLEASRATVKEFMQSLKGELQKGMQEGGPVNAIGVANTYSARKGWTVGRTSLRLRNPDNAPDAWEQGVLEAFEQRRQDGENPAGIEHYEAVEVDGEKVFRYMKAIPTAELCVVCHGSEIDPYVDARLKELYPQDRARGYQPGDIRGAFTIIQPLDGKPE
jgi:hypothetical protein